MATFSPVRFQRFGRSLHLRIRTPEDLRRVGELDEAHWVATGAPIGTINCDPTFLNLVDSDSNGRILCYEVKLAVSWLFGVLRDADGLAAGSDAVRLDAVDTDDPRGFGVEGHHAAPPMARR